MKASLFYRLAAVLIALFAVGHTLGFRQFHTEWRADAVIAGMRSLHFDVGGFSRSYWDLFEGAGFGVSVFYFFAAVLAWQLAGIAPGATASVRGIAWTFVVSFAAVTVVSCRYLFLLPIIFSALITVCLTVAAWLSSKKGCVPLPG